VLYPWKRGAQKKMDLSDAMIRQIGYRKEIHDQKLSGLFQR